MINWPLLSILTWLPILGGAFVFACGSHRAILARQLAFWISGASVVLCWPLYQGMDLTSAAFQWQELHLWIPSWNAEYALGIDGISLWLIVLSALMTFIVVLATWSQTIQRLAQYLGAFLIMQGCLVGVFSALDGLLFYLFWEGMLIPMYLIIGVWGGKNRTYAAIKFFLYTFLGSLFLLVAFLYLGGKAQSFRLSDWADLSLGNSEQLWLFLGFLAAFAVKIPMWPVHTWLPDAHTEAPTGGSVMLAAVLLKLGAYGLIRLSLPLLPAASVMMAWPMIILSLVAIVYIGFVALAQTDMKKLIAYSSIAHMGFVTLGCFVGYLMSQQDQAFAQMGVEGALIQVISHGLSSGALFLGFGMLYERMHTRAMTDFGGIAKVMPVFSALYLLFVMANVALPGTSGFVGEFMVILSTVKAHFGITALAALTLILGAAYTLWMYKQVFYGPIQSQAVQACRDIALLDRCLLLCLGILVIVLGVYPEFLLEGLHAPVQKLLTDMSMAPH